MPISEWDRFRRLQEEAAVLAARAWSARGTPYEQDAVQQYELVRMQLLEMQKALPEPPK